jgi:chemotaxis protein histidine kinase CheA
MGEVTQEEVESVLDHQRFLQQQGEKANEISEGEGKDPLVPLFPTDVSVDGQRLARIVSIVKQLAALDVPEALTPFIQELDQLTKNLNQGTGSRSTHYFQRLVRDFAIQYNKRVHFRSEGTEFMQEELDMLDFAEILIPLLRNSVQHGIESPDVRHKEQKKRNGRITLSVLRQAEELWVSVEDDGAGFDLKKIAKLCLLQGLVLQDELAQTTGAELLQIFLNNQDCGHENAILNAPQCTGLAVAKQLLQEFNAKMDIWSRPGKGARVTLRIPRASRNL